MADTADPLAGSYFVEPLTDELEAQAREWIAQVEQRWRRGHAIERGLHAERDRRKRLPARAGQRIGRRDRGRRQQVRRRRVGNWRRSSGSTGVDRAASRASRAYKAAQDRAAVDAALERGRCSGEGTENLLPVMKDALLAAPRSARSPIPAWRVFGEHRAMGDAIVVGGDSRQKPADQAPERLAGRSERKSTRSTSRRGAKRQASARQARRARARAALARRGLVRGARSVRPPPRHPVRDGRQPALTATAS